MKSIQKLHTERKQIGNKSKVLSDCEVEFYMNITALDARIITETAKVPIGAWAKLFELIKENAQLGYSMLIFDEEKENVKFKEHRKEVKKKLEELGYNVTYSRVKYSDNWHGEIYHNRYIINW